ncbi:MAG: ABC transporter permease [Oscillospiraceae bacterium]|nr:ABC transporter permease [Oscillospiraceae bacterium]
MPKYILKRILRSFLTMAIVITVVFSLLRLMPIEGYFENYDKLSQTQIDLGLQKLGLTDPLPKQLWNFGRQLLSGDLGTSIRYRKGVSINTIVAEKAPVSLQLGLTSLAIALCLGLPLGILMSRSTRTKWKLGDKLGTVFIVIIQAVPAAAYHILIQFAGSQGVVNLHWLGLDWSLRLPMLFKLGDYRSYILPILSLSIGNIAYYAMWLRRYMVDEANKDYIKLARAKGVPGGQISRKHVFRNAMVPLIQYIPNSILFTLMGSLYVESLYSIPGMGGLLVTVIKRQDNNMVLALVVIYAVISILGLLFGDLLMALLDPRITLAGKEESR